MALARYSGLMEHTMMAIGSMVKLPDQESFIIPTETFLKVITKTTKLMEKVPT